MDNRFNESELKIKMKFKSFYAILFVNLIHLNTLNATIFKNIQIADKTLEK